MKLTKLVHACVHVEDDEHSALFDPGEFSWKSGLVKLDNWSKLDYVMITHEHFDHFSEDFTKTIVQKFPNVQFFSTKSVAVKLNNIGIKNVKTTSDDNVEVIPLPHASMSPLVPDPNVSNTAFHYKNKISHPGDSHNLAESRDILFIPLAGSWGSAIEGIRMADRLKPKIIVPIHDWMWNDNWRIDMYDRMENYFRKQGIRFIKTVDGEPFEI